MPRGAVGIMFTGYLLIGLWGAILYKFRRNVPYILASGICSVHLLGSHGFRDGARAHFSPANKRHHAERRCRMYGQGLTLLWFTAIGLAAAYYLIPKVLTARFIVITWPR